MIKFCSYLSTFLLLILYVFAFLVKFWHLFLRILIFAFSLLILVDKFENLAIFSLFESLEKLTLLLEEILFLISSRFSFEYSARSISLRLSDDSNDSISDSLQETSFSSSSFKIFLYMMDMSS